MDTLIQPRFVPPIPPRPRQPLSLHQFLRAVRTNALTIWPEGAYRQSVSVRRFLGRHTVLLNDPEGIRHVLVENAGNYRRTRASVRILRPITGKGLLLSEGESWRLQRRTIAPALAPRVLPTLTPHIVTATQEAIGALTAQADHPVDLLAAMQNLALEIAGRSMFSLETKQFGSAMRRMLVEFGLNHARPHLLDMMLPPSIPTLRDIGRRRFQSRWMRLIEAIMHVRLAASASDTPRDLFDLLRTACDPETGVGFNNTELRDQIATMILAGHETTAVTLFWALTLLAQAPEEQSAVAREAAMVELSDPNALLNLVRARAVINEALRLFPPAFTIVREAVGRDRVAHTNIDRGDVMMIAPWVLHRHHAFWADPDVFDPTRFLPGATPPERFAYLPFGAGPRVCVGAQFAVAEATLALGAMMRQFEIRLADERPVLPIAIVTTQPDHPPPFHLRPR